MQMQIPRDRIAHDHLRLSFCRIPSVYPGRAQASQPKDRIVMLQSEDDERPFADDAVDLSSGCSTGYDALQRDRRTFQDLYLEFLCSAGITTRVDGEEVRRIEVNRLDRVGNRIDHRHNSSDEHDGEHDDADQRQALSRIPKKVGTRCKRTARASNARPGITYDLLGLHYRMRRYLTKISSPIWCCSTML